MTHTETIELTAEMIISADDITMERVEIPDWGGHVFVRVMSGSERDRMEQACLSASGDGLAAPENFRALLAVACCCNASGDRLFTAEQAASLAEKSSTALDLIFAVALRINKMSDRDVEDLAGK